VEKSISAFFNTPIRKCIDNTSIAFKLVARNIQGGYQMNKLELLTKIIELAEKRDEEEKELQKRYGKDKAEKDETGSETMVLVSRAEYVNAPRPRAAELESFVKGLSDEDIVYVAAVMSNHPDDVRELIHNILEEELLAEYSKAGIDVYKIT
jgi:hypothetical protein